MVTKKNPSGPLRVRERAATSSGTFPVSFSRAIPAGEFKARCLAIMEEVRERGGEYVITKRGKPVAKLVPIATDRRPLFGSMAGTGRTLGDIISPLDEPWEALGPWDDKP